MEDKYKQLLLENQICFPLYAVSRMVTKMYGPLLKDLDITYPQYLVLLVLWEKQEVTVSDLSKELLLETNTLTPLLKRMETKKILTRERSQNDERQVKVALTIKGKNMRQKAVCIPEQILSSIQTNQINVDEAINFQNTLNKILANFKANNKN